MALRKATGPSSSSLVVEIELPRRERVVLAVYDRIGDLQRVLFDGELPAGRHRVDWDWNDHLGVELPSGLYVIKLKSAEHLAVDKVMHRRAVRPAI
jgi:hypothetical protein